jgi:hypothetical protein
MEISLDDVKTFIEANKNDPAVSEYVISISVDRPLNIEVVKGYLETTEGQQAMEKHIDRARTQAVLTHDEKIKKEKEAEIARRVNEKLMEMNKEDTPEQRMIKEQNIRMKELEDKYENDKKLSKINEIAYKEGIDPAFVGGISFDSAEQFGLYANNFKNYIKKANEKALNEFIASTSVRPKTGNGPEDKFNVDNLSDKEILAMEMAGTLDAALKG